MPKKQAQRLPSLPTMASESEEEKRARLVRLNRTPAAYMNGPPQVPGMPMPGMPTMLGPPGSASPSAAMPPSNQLMAHTADENYPETEGYHEFVEEHRDVLEALADASSDAQTQAHMHKHLELMENSSHVPLVHAAAFGNAHVGC